MKVEWDYTELAKAYIKRPDYAREAIQKMLKIAGIQKGDRVCDVGAGVAHLTLLLLENGLDVSAVEPNDEMRKYGMQRTENKPNVQWFVGTGENTGMPDHQFNLVTFGSSFNVCDRHAALLETKRILKPQGWFACMWNHRDLEDPLQAEIENILKRNIPDYDYGTRREDQMQFLKDTGLFSQLEYTEAEIIHQIPADELIEAWRSHGTVHRQAKEKFQQIIEEISAAVQKHGKEATVPYRTKIWIGKML